MKIARVQKYIPTAVFVGFIAMVIFSCCSITSALVFWGVLGGGVLLGYLAAAVLGLYLGVEDDMPGYH